MQAAKLLEKKKTQLIENYKESHPNARSRAERDEGCRLIEKSINNEVLLQETSKKLKYDYFHVDNYKWQQKMK